MIALYILLGILLLLLLICFIRVQVFAHYDDDLKLSLKVLFFQIVLLPPKEKPEKKPEKPKKKKPDKDKEDKPKEEKEKEKKPSYLSKLKDKKGVTGLISLFKEIAKIAVGALKGIFSHIVFKKLDVGIAYNGGDAATTAVEYGKICSAFYPAINVLTSVTVCKSYNVTLEPIFDDERETEAYADVHLYIRVGFVLLEGVKAGVKLLIARMKL